MGWYMYKFFFSKMILIYKLSSNNIDIWVRVNLDDISINSRKEYMDPNIYKMGICCQM